MWLERFSVQSREPTPSASPSPSPHRGSSPAPRKSIQLGPSSIPRRPGVSPRTSSLAAPSFNASTESLPAAKTLHGSSLKNELVSSPAVDVPDPVDVLQRLLAPLPSNAGKSQNGEITLAGGPQLLEGVIDFEGLSLEEFAHTKTPVETVLATYTPLTEDLEQEKDRFESLHKSILDCDDVLKSVEMYLTSFQADLAAVSSEIEHLQHRSTALNDRLQNRKAVEKILGPEVETFAIPPVVVRKITEGAVDDAWVKALDELEKRSKAIDAKLKEGRDIKASQDVRPFIEDVGAKAVERIRDYVVAQIKALRSPSINAQVIQQTKFLRYKDVFAFLARRQPQLGEEISQAYINTMRWYYSSHFARYKMALEKLSLHSVDQGDTLASDFSGVKRASSKPGAARDPFSLGRRADILQSTHDAALPSFAAEEDKGIHFLEVPFRAFNLALVDNASAEYAFLTEFFSKQPFQATNRQFSAMFAPTFALGHDLTKALISDTLDALGILTCVRLTQHLAFELQRRKIPTVESYINGTNMLLWPRFQQAIDAHCESIRKFTASLSGKPAGSALTLTASSSNAQQTTAPHPLTQRFANFTQSILSLSSDANDDEPVSHSLGRLRADFEVFLVKLSKGIAETRKRDRFLYNNYSLIATIIADTDGKMADELRDHFDGLKNALNVDS